MKDVADAQAEAREERDLIDRARRGDSDAMHRLVDRYAQPLYGAAVYLTRNRSDAADAVQETLLAMVRSIDRFRGESTFRTWLWAILIRQAARIRRQRQPQSAMPEGASGGEAAATDLRMDIHAALMRLPDDHRDVLMLREFQGLSYDEMARALGVPRGTIESRLNHAQAALRRGLPDYAPADKEARHG